MPSRHTLSIGLCLLLVFLFNPSWNAWADEDPPFLLDLSQLKLKIVSTELVTEVGDFLSGTLSSGDENEKLVVVTLSGNIPRTCRLSLQSDEFMAVTETPQFATMTRSLGIYFTGTWTVSKNNSVSVFSSIKNEPGPISLKVAFALPKDVQAFSVSFPGLIGKKAILSTAK